MSRDLLDLVRELNTLNDDNLADRVIANSDVQRKCPPSPSRTSRYLRILMVTHRFSPVRAVGVGNICTTRTETNRIIADSADRQSTGAARRRERSVRHNAEMSILWFRGWSFYNIYRSAILFLGRRTRGV